MLEVGRLCLKIAGREAGKHCVVVKSVDDSFVMVTGPFEITRVKRRRCNIHHLEPLEEKIGIKAEATDSEIIKEYEKEDIYAKLGIEKPSPEKVKEIREMRAEKEKQKDADGISVKQAAVREAVKPKEEKKAEKEDKAGKAEKEEKHEHKEHKAEKHEKAEEKEARKPAIKKKTAEKKEAKEE